MCTDYLYLWIGIRVQRLQCRIEQTEVNFHSVHRLFLFSKKNEKRQFFKDEEFIFDLQSKGE